MNSLRYQVVPQPSHAEDEECPHGEIPPGVNTCQPQPCVILRRSFYVTFGLVGTLCTRGLILSAKSKQSDEFVSTGSIAGVEQKFSAFQFSMEAYEKLFGDTDPFNFSCPVPGVGSAAGMDLPFGPDKIASCCSGYNSMGWPFQFPQCSRSQCTTCWMETPKDQMAAHPMIHYAAASWAAAVTVTGEAKPKYGWLGQSVSQTFSNLVSGDLATGNAVDDAAVKSKRMTVRLGRGLVGGEAEVCPAIDDWDIDMLNEAQENIHARVFKSTKAKLAIVAFRGTQLQSTKNWKVDADIERVPLNLGNGSITMVHEGFIKALHHVLPQVKRWVIGYVFGMVGGIPQDWDLVFAGHSLGGALALLATTQAELEKWERRPKATIIFGAPRVADANLDKWWQSQGICNHLIRVNSYNDLVHNMPFHKMWNAWNVATDAVDCIKSPIDCLTHGAHQASDILHGGDPSGNNLVMSTQWQHVCPQSEVLVPSRMKGINEVLEERSLFGGVLAHLTDNCMYGYAYGVQHSNLSNLDGYCGISSAVCDRLSDVKPV